MRTPDGRWFTGPLFDRRWLPPLRAPGALPAWAAERWEAFFFEPVAPARLAVLRIVLITLQALLFTKPLADHLDLIRFNDSFVNPEPLMRLLTMVVPESVVRTEGVLTAVYYGAWVPALLAVLGVVARPMVALYALSQWFLVLHRYSYGEKHHPEALFLLVLLLLSLTPCDRALSISAWRKRRQGRHAELNTTDGMWVLRTGMVLLSTAYFMAGLCKMVLGGFAWMKGPTLQGYMLQDAVRWDLPVGLWLCRQSEMCTVSSVMAVGFELFFPVILFVPRLAPVFLLMGASFHTGVYITQAAPFFQFIALYLMWVPFERAFARREGGLDHLPVREAG